MKTARRILLGSLLAAAAMLGTATPALAHTRLTSSDPADGAALATAPTRVSLTFAEAVGIPDQPITIAGPGGAGWQVGKATASGATVTAPVTATGPAGAYTLSYSVIADDGDEVTGKVAFTLTTAVTPTTAAAHTTTAAAPTAAAVAAPPTPAPADPAARGVPGWVWVLVAVVVLAAAGGVVFARSRRSSGR